MDRPIYIVPSSDGGFGDEHEKASRAVFAAVIGKLIGGHSAGVLPATTKPPPGSYFVPSDTLLADAADRLGIRSEDDLLGGVVPFPFVATKAITHGLVAQDCAAPEGWQRSLAPALGDAVLPGFTCFCREDAEQAGRALLERGDIRAKRVNEVAARGQFVAHDEAELIACLDKEDWHAIAGSGVALERNVKDPTTYSVGRVRVGGATISYHGLQKMTADNEDNPTYGGSVLLVANGGFDALLELELSEPVRTAVEQARRFDAAVGQAYPAFFASRRNYDVIQGYRDDGSRCSGVLEQSWRIGGATGAELAALLAFRDSPHLKSVKARTVEIFGEEAEVPEGALLLFRGDDPRVGRMTKYAVADA